MLTSSNSTPAPRKKTARYTDDQVGLYMTVVKLGYGRFSLRQIPLDWSDAGAAFESLPAKIRTQLTLREGEAVRIIFHLVQHAKDIPDGVYFRQDELAEQLGVCRKTANRIIKRLVELKIIVSLARTPVRIGCGRGAIVKWRTNVYEFTAEVMGYFAGWWRSLVKRFSQKVQQIHRVTASSHNEPKSTKKPFFSSASKTKSMSFPMSWDNQQCLLAAQDERLPYTEQGQEDVKRGSRFFRSFGSLCLR